jgi:uncharacterized protein YecT (DUF1311 family)
MNCIYVLMTVIALLSSARAGTNNFVCAEATTQREINECASRAFRGADEDLNRLYRETSSKLSGKTKEKLRKAQVAWLRYRDSTCEAEVALLEGGSMAPAARSFCLDRVTRSRTDEILNTYKIGRWNTE